MGDASLNGVTGVIYGALDLRAFIAHFFELVTRLHNKLGEFRNDFISVARIIGIELANIQAFSNHKGAHPNIGHVTFHPRP
jgi:hypothetical protein